MTRSRLLLVLALGVALGLSLSLTATVIAARAGTATGGGRIAEDRAAGLPWQDARLLAEVLQRVQSEYVDAVPERKLMENAVRGMLEGLDAYSTYLDAAEYEQLRASTAGRYPGIGIEVNRVPEGLAVLRPIEDAPAARAGVLAGDLIVAIDGEELAKLGHDDAIDRLRGKAGTRVQIRVRRDGAAGPLDFLLERRQVEVHSVVAGLLEPGYGYIRIRQFSETTATDLRDALRTLARPQPLAGLVLDLRNNPGGVLDAAVDSADLFLDAGNIVSASGRGHDAGFRLDATPGDLTSGAPIVVLMNGASASAAEILAGALRDNGRATLVGRRSYGKGSVQTLMPLSGGGAVKLTTSRYFTPSGASINEKGIEPDVPYAGEDLAPAPLDAAGGAETLSTRDAQVRFALESLRRPSTPRVAASNKAAA
jgi:carboxyl-terminal processing protease